MAIALFGLLGSHAVPAGAAGHEQGGGTWRRVDPTRSGVEPRAWLDAIRAGGPGFVATGSIRAKDSDARSTPAIWTSRTGEQWSRVPARDTHLDDELVTGLVVRAGAVLVATEQGRVIRSVDGRHWRRWAQLPGVPRVQAKKDEAFAARSIGLYPGPRGLVAILSDPDSVWSRVTWSSSPDARRWYKTTSVGTEADPVGLPPRVRLRDRWLAVAPSYPDPGVNQFVFASTDGVRWTKTTSAPPPRAFAPGLWKTAHGGSVLGIQFEPPNGLGGRLWRTRDAVTWTEIASFHRAMPTGNPDHFARSGRWWVLGGNTGVPGDWKRPTTMWASRDLRHWYEMPAELRGSGRQSGQVAVAAAKGRVLGFQLSSQSRRQLLWVWRPPA